MNETNPYESPKHASTGPPTDAGDGDSQERAARRAWRRQDFVFALAQQGICLGIMSLVLDNGTMFRVCLAAVIVHWVSTAMVVVRHPTSPTILDLGALRFGFFFCLLVVFTCLAVLPSLRP